MDDNKSALFKYCLRLGDTSLILGQRMAEWCSKGPILEEDIAMTNLALDFFGQAQMILSYAAEVEGKGRTNDDLAYKRNEREFYNTLLSEQPNGNFGNTIVRNFLLDAFLYHQYKALEKSTDQNIATYAAKSVKEIIYHLRHASEWLIRLGLGTEESKKKVQTALNNLWDYTDDLFSMDEIDTLLIKQNIAVDKNLIKESWEKTVNEVLQKSSLTKPEKVNMKSGSIKGLHSEHLGHLLCEMQYLQRAHPNASW